MTRVSIALLFLLATLCASESALAERRFPPPDFETGYTQPPLTFQEDHTGTRQYLDIFVLVFAMGLAAWLLHTKRSRSGLFLLGIGSLLYFGFYKKGCVCPIGSIQNVVLGLFDPTYIVSLPVIAFFVLPLLFALLWGRVFCGAVCPLGAIQDLFYFRSVRVPLWLERPLGLFRYFYLGLAVYFALVHNRFVICEYDPFVSLFRFNGPFWRFMLGLGFLAVGLFIARPYCRYLCPYGALLSMLSRFTGKGVTITPKDCIDCTLCDASCPFEAIKRPAAPKMAPPPLRNSILLACFLAPIALTLAGYALVDRAWPGALLGFWFGLVIAGSLIRLIRTPGQKNYEPDHGACLSCGRCYKWCPHERADWDDGDELEAENEHAA